MNGLISRSSHVQQATQGSLNQLLIAICLGESVSVLLRVVIVLYTMGTCYYSGS
jgi:hypothetical protein